MKRSNENKPASDSDRVFDRESPSSRKKAGLLACITFIILPICGADSGRPVVLPASRDESSIDTHSCASARDLHTVPFSHLLEEQMTFFLQTIPQQHADKGSCMNVEFYCSIKIVYKS